MSCHDNPLGHRRPQTRRGQQTVPAANRQLSTSLPFVPINADGDLFVDRIDIRAIFYTLLRWSVALLISFWK